MTARATVQLAVDLPTKYKTLGSTFQNCINQVWGFMVSHLEPGEKARISEVQGPCLQLQSSSLA